MGTISWVLGIGLILSAAMVVGVVFLIRYFIRYNAKVKTGQTMQAQRDKELEQMKIDDL